MESIIHGASSDITVQETDEGPNHSIGEDVRTGGMQPIADFERRRETFVDELHAVPLAQDAEAIFYPGEIEARNEAANRSAGLLLPEDTVADLIRLAIELVLDHQWIDPPSSTAA